MSYLFSECYELKEIKGINKFNTNKVTNMCAMFQTCKELECIDLSNFDTSNVIDMSFMFNECNNLKYLNILNFYVNDITEEMFYNTPKNGCELITDNQNLYELFKSSN